MVLVKFDNWIIKGPLPGNVLRLIPVTRGQVKWRTFSDSFSWRDRIRQLNCSGTNGDNARPLLGGTEEEFWIYFPRALARGEL